MNAEYLLDAVGLLDDELIREAEGYSRTRRDYSRWIGLAAGLAVVLTLGYGLTHLNLGMGGGAAPENQASGGAASMPGGVTGTEAPPDFGAVDFPSGAAPQEPGGAENGGGTAGDVLSAFMADGTVYRDTGEYITIEPKEEDIRYTASFTSGVEPEEDGQANFLPVGTAYVLLEDGRAAVRDNEESGSWRIYDPVPPWEK